MSAVDDALVEVNAALATTKPILEGFQDDNRLNIQEATRSEVNIDITTYSQRVESLNATKLALENLLAIGYPELPVREIPKSAYDDLQEQAATIAAALAKYKPTTEAEVLKATVGTPVPK